MVSIWLSWPRVANMLLWGRIPEVYTSLSVEMQSSSGVRSSFLDTMALKTAFSWDEGCPAFVYN